MVFGKIIGGVLGFSSAGIIGACVGVFVGNYFDKAFGGALGFDHGADRERLQRLFFETTFTVMGHMAKADGHISEEEIKQAEALMQRLGLSDEHRQQAIQFFKQGSQADFQLEPTITNFVSEGGRKQNLTLMLLEFLFSIAMADGELHPAERQILSQTASLLGISARQFDQLLSMLSAQYNFSQGNRQGGQQQYQQRPRVDEVAEAYKALGVASSDSDKDIKKAYRKLMSRHHPDKLAAQGMPEDMMKMATEKAQEIQVAYDIIKTSRK